VATIEEIRNLAEPLKGYQFQVVISDPAGEDGASGEILQFRCTALSLPGKTIEETLVNLDGYNVKYAGRSIHAGLWTTTFIESTQLEVIDRVYSWQDIAHNSRSGVQGDSQDYKRVARLELLNNNRDVTYVRRIVGIWPQDIPDIAFDKASSEATRVDVTWAYDYDEKA